MRVKKKHHQGACQYYEMDKDASYLRCSKLTCYAEFNRMVNAVAKHGTTAGVVNGKDYCFSAALASMLRDVTSNPDEQDQKRELEKVHDWFLANKPLLFSPKARKPLHLTPTTDTLSRPRTAPALLSNNASDGKKNETEFKDKVRPHTTFVANYMTTVLGINSEAAVPTYRASSKGCERRCISAKMPTRITHTKTGHYRRKPAVLSKVLIPGRGESVTETYRSSNKQMNLSEVYDFASQVADQMIAEKQELEQCRQTMKDLLVPVAVTAPAKDVPPGDCQNNEQLNVDNATEGSTIKVSVSQDSLLTKSPQHTSDKKLGMGSTLSHLTETSSSFTEKNTVKQEVKLSRKGNRAVERFHSHVRVQLYEFPDNGKTNSNSEFVKHPKPLATHVAGFNTKRYTTNTP